MNDFSDLSGKEIRGYTLWDRLGGGHYSTVYRGYQASVEREVAVKLIAPSAFGRPDVFQRFTQEARTIATLRHPHIIALFDYWADENGAYIVMPFMSGGSVGHVLRSGALSLERTTALLQQMVDALAAVHEMGIVHRDLKPSNVLLDQYGNGYLADFGLAKLLSGVPSITDVDGVVGTRFYMAPEQWLVEPVDPRTDIYALGVCLYEMLTGRVPFQAADTMQLMRLHLEEPPPPLAETRTQLPGGIEQVIHKAMAKRPQDRFQTVHELWAAYQMAAQAHETPAGVTPFADTQPADRPTLEPIVSPRDHTGTYFQALRRRLAGLVALLVVGLALVMLLTSRGEGTSHIPPLSGQPTRGSASVAGTQLPPPPTTRPNTYYVLLHDGFDGPDTRSYWLPADTSSRQWLQDDGMMRLIPGTANFPAEYITVFEPIQDALFSARFQLESTIRPDPADALVGLVLRYREASRKQDYYVFGVEFQSRTWVFARYSEQGYQKTREPLAQGDLTAYLSDPRTAFELSAWSQGDTYQLAIDGAVVATVQDATLSPEGHFGVINDNRTVGLVAYLVDEVWLELTGNGVETLAAMSPTPPPTATAAAVCRLSDAVAAIRALNTTLLAQPQIDCAAYVRAFDALLEFHYCTGGFVQNQVDRILATGDNLKNVCYELGRPANYTVDDHTRQTVTLLGIAIPEVLQALTP